MRIAILTPSYIPQISGNATTVNRLVIGLKNKGIITKVIDLSRIKGEGKIFKIIKEFNPDIIQGYQAFKSGVIALQIAKKLKKPLIINVPGTDANHDLFDKEKRPKIIEVLGNTGKIIVFHKSIGNIVLKNVPSSKSRIGIIKQSVKLEKKKFDLRKKLNIGSKDILFLLPAGIRKIKYQKFCVDGFKKIHSKYPNTKVVLCGPVLEKDFAENFFNKIKGLDWIYYLDKIDHNKMYNAMKSSDVVMNKSISEGGMSNAVLEAMYVGRPVLASNIEGNRSIIKDNVNGLLFSSEDDFVKKAELLIKNKKLRDRLGKKSKEILRKNFSFKEEIDGYVRVYKELLS